ncbi:MAG: hypothetical protein R6V25_03575 [Desulfatiglandales bacterium]
MPADLADVCTMQCVLFNGMWASRASIKSNAASLKEFYAFMVAKAKVTQEDLDDLKTQIKEEMPEWLATLARYDDPDIDDPAEVWGL